MTGLLIKETQTTEYDSSGNCCWMHVHVAGKAVHRKLKSTQVLQDDQDKLTSKDAHLAWTDRFLIGTPALPDRLTNTIYMIIH